MKKPLFFSLILACTLLAGCGTANKGTSSNGQILRTNRIRTELVNPNSREVLVAMHRGDWRNYPENSLPAIESAISMGVDIMELDVKMTSDGALVLCHDNTVDRTTTGKGPVSYYTLDSLKRLRLLRAHGVNTDSTRMPTLEEAFRLCKDRIMVNVDGGFQWYNHVMELARKVGVEDQIIMKSNQSKTVVDATLAKFGDDVIFMPIIGIAADGSCPLLDEYLASGDVPIIFECCFSKDTPAVATRIKQIRDAGSKVWINSIWGSLCGYHDDDKAYQSKADADREYGRLLEMGANVLQSDRADFTIGWLHKHHKHPAPPKQSKHY